MQDVTKTKTIISILILIICAILVAVAGTGTTATVYQSSGLVFDFEQNTTTWIDVDFNEVDTIDDLISEGCDSIGYHYIKTDDGNIIEVNGIENNDFTKWDVWVVEKGDLEWTKISYPYTDKDPSDYTVIVLAFRGEGEEPSVGVDSIGNSIYGYKRSYRTVSLSPTISELVGAVKADTTLVGVDMYSDYPETIPQGIKEGNIAVVGDFLNPSFESIIKTDPDIVFCDGAQYNHYMMLERLREANIPAILTYPGTDIETVYKNLHIIGVSLGYELSSHNVIEELQFNMERIQSDVESTDKAMIALSPDVSPWVSGEYTIANDVLIKLGSENAFSNMDGWVQINSELIMKNNPSLIVIVSDSYAPTQEEYDLMMNNLPKEWRTTDAYKNGNVYLLCDDAVDICQRSGPRALQFMELMSLIIDSDPDLPKIVGDEYRDYLKYTGYL